MSSAPQWIENWVWFAAVIACGAFVVFSDPVYNRVRAPSLYPYSSTLSAALIMAALAAAAWWIFVAQLPSKTSYAAPQKGFPITFSPEEVIEKVNQADALDQDEVKKAFINRPVDWTLKLSGRQRKAADPNQLEIFFKQRVAFPQVVCEVPYQGHEYFRLAKSEDVFRIRGVIRRIGIQNIVLGDSQIEAMQPSTTPTASASAASEHRLSEVQAVPPPPDSKVLPESKAVSNLGPSELFALIEGRTPLQAAKLIEPYKGSLDGSRGRESKPHSAGRWRLCYHS